MAIISGYKPVQQPEIVKPFTLPFNEMYTALKDKQAAYDVESDKSDALFATLGSIQNLLPKDLMTHRDKMSNLLSQEEALRDQAGGDLARPEYKQGLRKLIMSTAMDPFYPTAMGNYQTVTEQYLPAYQKMVESGITPEDWQYNGDFNSKYVKGYEGAVDAEGNLNRLEFKGISPQGNYLGKAADLTKEIIAQKYGNIKWDPSLGVYVNESGVKLTEEDIRQTLWSNKNLLESTPDYELYRKKFFSNNPGATEDQFMKHLDDSYKGIAKIFNRDDKETSYAFGASNEGSGKGSGSGGDEDNAGNYFLQFPDTTASASIGWETPEKRETYVQNTNRILTKQPAPADRELNIWTKKDGINDLQTKLSKQVGSDVTIEPSYDASTGRTTFTINALDPDGNVKNILPDSPEYKKNAIHILNLQAEHEYLNTAVQRAEEFDTQARSESGYDPNIETQNMAFNNNYNKKYLDDLESNTRLSGKYYKAYTSSINEGMSNEQKLQAYKKATTDYYSTLKFVKMRAAGSGGGANTGVYKDEDGNEVYIQLQPGDNPNTDPVKALNELDKTIKKSVFDSTPAGADYKRKRTAYEKIYEESYGDGYYLQQEWGSTFGTNESAAVKGYQQVLINNAISRLGMSANGSDYGGIAAYDVATNEQLDSDAYNEIGKTLATDEFKRANVTANWRVDEGGDGIVVDIFVPLEDGVKRLEMRDIGGIVEFLAQNGYGDLAQLKLMDAASKTTKRGNVEEGVGEGGDFGYIGGLDVQGYGTLPKMQFKRHALPITQDGVQHEVGSYEISVFDPENPGTPKKLIFDNMFDLVKEGYLGNLANVETYIADNLLEKVIQTESAGDPNAVNPTSGAFGLMQLMDNGALADWNMMNGQSLTKEQAMDPNINKQIGTWYLQKRIPTMLQQYGLPLSPEYMLMAYNWGIGNLMDWYKGKGQYKGKAKDYSLVPQETKQYVKKILG